MSHTVLVIGGGAAGLMAAITAAMAGARVTVVERCERVGRKLLATGNGRCNLTNTGACAAHYHGHDPQLVRSVLAQVPPDAVLDFFSDLGLHCRTEEEGRVYPASGQASAVLDVLRLACARLGVTLQCGQAVRGLSRTEAGFSLTLADGQTLPGECVIVATGGRAAPKLGSDGSGFVLLTALGHTLRPCLPALVQLRCDHPSLPSLKGLRCDAHLTLHIPGAPDREALGEVLFTDYGLSGIAVLSLSRWVGPAVAAKLSPVLSLCLTPDWTTATRHGEVRRRRSLFSQEPVGLLFTGLLPRRIGESLCKAADIALDSLCADLTDTQCDGLGNLLGQWRFPVTGTQSFEQAQVTLGGMDTTEFDPVTLQSNKVPGLYAAGEVLDVDGDCGGFNLQFAWASGMLAGRGAGRQNT